MKNEKQKIERLVFETYLAVIKNSIGCNMFRNFFAKIDGQKVDIMRGGELSCAFFASSILTLAKYIKEIHGTVDSTVKDLTDSGWQEIKEPRLGCVLVWEKANFGGTDARRHIGFYVGDDKAISNDYRSRSPAEHHWTYDGQRKIELILWKQDLEKI